MENQNEQSVENVTEIPFTRDTPYVPENNSISNPEVNETPVFEVPIMNGPSLAEQLDNPTPKVEESVVNMPSMMDEIEQPSLAEQLDNPQPVINNEPIVQTPSLAEQLDNSIPVEQPTMNTEPIVQNPNLAEQLDNPMPKIEEPIINNAPIEQPIKPQQVIPQPIVRSKEREINNDSSDDNKSGLLFLVILAVIIGGFIYVLPNTKNIGKFFKDTYNNLTSKSSKQTVNNTPKKEAITTPVSTKKAIRCTMTEYDEEYAADLEMIALANFDNDKLTNLTTNAIYTYKSLEELNTRFPEETTVGEINLGGLTMHATIDRANLIYSLSMTANVTDLESNGWKLEEGATLTDFSYNSVLKYVEEQGLSCQK